MTRCTLSIATLPLVAQAGMAQCDFSQAGALTEAIVDDRGLVTGASLRLADPLLPGPSFEDFYGDFGPSTVVPIASATKLLSALVVMSCVEQDGLDLDAPVSTFLPEFVGQKGTMTVRQMFSHTSGMPGNSAFVFDPTITLQQAVTRIALFTPLQSTPGSDFCYSQVGMHIAGRVCEVVTGTDWDTLFIERVGDPLGLTDTDYDGLLETTNPLIAGGAQSSLEDYGRVMRMLVDGGVYRGTRVLEQSSIDLMFSNLTRGLPIRCTPGSTSGLDYGLGVWVQDRPDGTKRIESPGAFAYTPWIDLDADGQAILSGVFMIEDAVSDLRADIVAVQDATLDARLACSPCAADLDNDGQLTLFDFLAFQGAWAAQDATGDFDRNGSFDVFDFLEFSHAFDAGCV